MSEAPCNTVMLDRLRNRALLAVAGATDPLIRQQYADLAARYATTATELREHGAAILPSPTMTHMPWRSVSLWVTNDR